MKKKVILAGNGSIASTMAAELLKDEQELPVLNTPQKYGKSDILSNVYIDLLKSNEEIEFYFNHFGGLNGSGSAKNPTQEKYKNMPKPKLLELYEEVNNKTSNLSKRERDLVTYYATK